MARAAERGAAGTEAAAPPPQILRSGLLPRLAEFQQQRADTALDLGVIGDEKLRFLAPFARRAAFDNFPGCTADLLAGGATPSAEALCASLRVPGPFGLVLLWDYLDYIDRDVLRPFLQRIAQSCERGALVYFLVSQTRFVPPAPSVLEVRAPDQIVFRNDPWTHTSARHPPQVVKEMMPGFTIRKLFLLKNGIQEHVFARTS